MTGMIDGCECWSAVLRRDASEDGRFYFAVVTTGVFCKPSCPSRRPKRENVRFFATLEDARRNGFRPCLRCRPGAREDESRTAGILRVCRYIERHLEDRLTLKSLAALASLSPWHFQRTFKAFAGVTPAEYVRACRMWALKKALRGGGAVTEAVYEAGYGSPSRVYENAGALGMPPAKYRRGAPGEEIVYTIVQTDLGLAILASSDRGICSIQFGTRPEVLIDLLRREFPNATLRHDDGRLRDSAAALGRFVSGRSTELKLPLDVRATAFQRKVWSYLRTLGYGETRTYAQVAGAIGQPGAFRAVARACAANPAALAIPCHRVVAATGALSGYRWGADRKRALLEREADKAKT